MIMVPACAGCSDSSDHWGLQARYPWGEREILAQPVLPLQSFWGAAEKCRSRVKKGIYICLFDGCR